jgi:hypothetical protein
MTSPPSNTGDDQARTEAQRVRAQGRRALELARAINDQEAASALKTHAVELPGPFHCLIAMLRKLIGQVAPLLGKSSQHLLYPDVSGVVCPLREFASSGLIPFR